MSTLPKVRAPKRREGESIEDYGERLQRFVRPDAPTITGAVARSDGIRHWSEAFTERDGSIRIGGLTEQEREDMERAVKADLPPIVRQSPRQKLKYLTDALVEHYHKTKAIFGYPVFPPSILREIQAEYWKAGHAEVTIEGLVAYATDVFEKAERQNPQHRTHDVRGAAHAQ